MKSIYTLVLLTFVLLLSLNVSAQQFSESGYGSVESESFHVIPPEYAGTPGTATFLGPFATTPRTYQFLINESLLTNLVGLELSAFSFRIPTSATANWPTADVSFTNYDVYLSESVPPANRSLTFVQNVVGNQTLVRSAPLIVSRDAYLFGSSPNPWGPEITFTTPWLYNGGHLLIELRHSGFTGTSRSTDAIGTSITGYGTLFSACWGSGYTAVSGSQGNFTIIRLTAGNPIPVELISFSSAVNKNNVELSWATATETNNKGFEIERASSVTTPIYIWEKIGFVDGAGSTTEVKHYSFKDMNLTPGQYRYRLKQIDFDGTFSYSNEVEVVVANPLKYALNQNYPNPFNPTTTIGFGIVKQENVRLSISNILGEEIKILLDEEKSAGYHSIEFNAADLPSGVYLINIQAGSFVETKKMILQR